MISGSEHFDITFEGPSVDDGQMDICDLASTLLALSGMIKIANAEINGNRASVAVTINRIRLGSFVVDLAMHQTLLQGAKNLLDGLASNRDGIAAAKDLWELLFGSLATGTGVLGLIRLCRGRKPERVEEKEDGTCEVWVGDGSHPVRIVFGKRALALVEQVEFRKKCQSFFASLSSGGVDRIRVSRAGQEPFEMKKEEVELLAFQADEVLVEDAVRTTTLQVVSLTFSDGGMWTFFDGAGSLKASVEDDDFLRQIDENLALFGKGDYIRCRLRERAFKNPKGLRKECSVVEVLEHTHHAQQGSLLFH